MGDTSIEWADKVWNCVRGCSRVSAGCKNCYAERIAARNLPEMRSPTTGKPFAHFGSHGPQWTGKVELIASKLDEPLRWRKPQRVFVNSMSDLFHEGLCNEDIERVFAVMALAPQHTFQVLTKRPSRMREWFSSGVPGIETREEDVQRAAEWRGKVIFDSRGSDRHRYPPSSGDVSNRRVWPGWPLPNVWLGVSVEDQATADERIPLLLQTPAAVRFVSYEPALAAVDFNRLTCRGCGSVFQSNPRPGLPQACPHCGKEDGDGLAALHSRWITPTYGAPRLDWVIVGAESGPRARLFLECWPRSARDQCQDAGVAFFYKQSALPGGRKVSTPELDGRRYVEFPA